MDDLLPQALGHRGEEQAARFLARRGLRVVSRHYNQKWGEIDLICMDRDTWVFVEVKTRSACWEPSAIAAVTAKKQLRIARAAMSYMKWKRLEGCPMRFDVVTIEAGAIQWIQNAFDLPSHYTC